MEPHYNIPGLGCKGVEPFNGLSPGEAELLDWLSEECGEVVQILGKIKRHGFESHHPDNPGETNRRLLTKEVGDFMAAAAFLINKGLINGDLVYQRKAHKTATCSRWLHHN